MTIWHVLGASVDFIHALLMVLWIAGMPLLVYRRHASLTRAYAVYAIGFIVAYQLSRWLLGECFLTTLARSLWERAPGDALQGTSDEWFTVRLAKAVFDVAPSQQLITIVAQILVLLSATGSLISLFPRGSRHSSSTSGKSSVPGAVRST